jgi:hypothetical protein
LGLLLHWLMLRRLLLLNWHPCERGRLHRRGCKECARARSHNGKWVADHRLLWLLLRLLLLQVLLGKVKLHGVVHHLLVIQCLLECGLLRRWLRLFLW